MAHVQELQIEIQRLKEALDASERKSDRYSQMVTTLYDELVKLQSNICHGCKKRLLVPTTKSGPELELKTPNSHQLKSEHPKFSVEYNPQVKRSIDLHLEHVFTHGSPAFCVKISPDSRRIAVGSRDTGETIIYEVKTRSNVRVFVDRFIRDPSKILSVKFSPDGRLFATAANDPLIRIWNITQNRMCAVFKGHENELNCISFSPDGRSIVSGSDDHSVRVSNIRDGSSKKLPVTNDAGFFLSVVFSPDGRYIAAGDTIKSLWIWDSRTQKLVANWKGHSVKSVRFVEFTPDGKGLMSGGMDTTVKYWDVSSLGIHKAMSRRETVVTRHSFPLIRSFPGHTGDVRSIAFFPGRNEWFITGSEDRSVLLWDIRTGVWQLAIRGHKEAVRDVDISETENILASASTDCQVTLWRFEVL